MSISKLLRTVNPIPDSIYQYQVVTADTGVNPATPTQAPQILTPSNSLATGSTMYFHSMFKFYKPFVCLYITSACFSSGVPYRNYKIQIIDDRKGYNWFSSPIYSELLFLDGKYGKTQYKLPVPYVFHPHSKIVVQIENLSQDLSFYVDDGLTTGTQDVSLVPAAIEFFQVCFHGYRSIEVL